MTGLWTDEHFPKTFEEFIGNFEIVDEARKWATAWSEGKPQKPLLFFGATGVGKTCLAFLLAKQFNWSVFELNASDLRNKDTIDRIVGVASQGASFSGSKRLVLLDEIDGLQSRDRGGAGAIVKIIKESKNPVILTANNIYKDQKLAPIRQASQLMSFKRINYLSIASRLKQLLTDKGIEFDPDAVKGLAKNCKGDFRSALLDTQTLSLSGKVDEEAVSTLGFRERQENVFKVVETIFKGKTVGEIRKARFSSEISNDLLFRWVEENIPRAYADPTDVANAFNVLSRADIFEGRIFNRQHYGFKRYSSELFTSGVGMSKAQECHGWLKLQFPQLLKKLSASSSLRAMKKELGRKIGKKVHSSPREVISSDLVYLKMLFKDKERAARLSAEFDLDGKEIAFMLDAKPGAKKPTAVLEKALELKQKHIVEKRRSFSALGEHRLKQFEQPEETKAAEKEPEEDLDHKQSTLF